MKAQVICFFTRKVLFESEYVPSTKSTITSEANVEEAKPNKRLMLSKIKSNRYHDVTVVDKSGKKLATYKDAMLTLFWLYNVSVSNEIDIKTARKQANSTLFEEFLKKHMPEEFKSAYPSYNMEGTSNG